MMRGVPVHDRDAFVNQAMGECNLLRWDFVTPVAAPVDRRDDQVAGLLMRAHLIAHSRCGRF